MDCDASDSEKHGVLGRGCDLQVSTLVAAPGSYYSASRRNCCGKDKGLQLSFPGQGRADRNFSLTSQMVLPAI